MGKWFYDMWTGGIDSNLIFDEEDQFTSDCEKYINDTNGNNGFIKVRYHWSDDPTKNDEWYKAQCRLANFDEKIINQEYDLEFLGSKNSIFPDSFLSKIKPIAPVDVIDLRSDVQLKLYKKFPDFMLNQEDTNEYLDPNDFYLFGIDSAKSLIGDKDSHLVFNTIKKSD